MMMTTLERPSQNKNEAQTGQEKREYIPTPEEINLILDGMAAVIMKMEEEKKRDVLIPTMLNKRASHEAIEQRVEAGKPFGVYMIDLNNFKKLNDTVNHAAGDQVLIRLGELFKREADAVVGRMGGDEFVLLVDLSAGEDRTADVQEQMDNVYDRIKIIEQELVQGDEPALKAAREIGVGFSIGGAVFDPDHPLDPEALYAQAEEAMYEEKEGKGR